MTLTLVTLTDGHQLAPAPAAAYSRALAAGCPAGITSAYRTPEAQGALRAAYLASPASHAYAAPVDQSEHVTGNAIDLPAAAAVWMRAHPDFGLEFTDPTEWWHVAYRVALDRHLTDTVTLPASLTPIAQEDDMYTDADRTRDNNSAASLKNIESILAIEDTGTGPGGIRSEVQRVRPYINTVATILRTLATDLGHPTNL